jgi:CRISPR/Cas system-associated endoribonuclease Cas2
MGFNSAFKALMTSKNGYNMYREWTKIDYQDKHCITDQTDKET